MDGKFKILSDSTCDMPIEYLREQEITLAYMSYFFGNTEYNDGSEKRLSVKEFYNAVRQGRMPHTAQINPDTAKKLLLPFARENTPLLCLVFSSALSGTCQSFFIARDELLEEYPSWPVAVVDSRAASMGEGLLLDYAVSLRNKGLSLEETAADIETSKYQLCHYFTVDDLHHLARGGRLSGVSALLGSILGIKPLLYCSDEGKLLVKGKIRTRRRSLDWLADEMQKHLLPGRYNRFFVSHGDCLEDAEYVARRVTELTGLTDYMIHPIGPVIGTHSGPGTVALFFFGDRREP